MRAPPDDANPQGMYWDHMTGWGWAFMILLSVVWLVAVVVITWAMVTIMRNDASRPSRHDRRPSRGILDERLARGELDLEEYRSLRAAIDDPVSPDDHVPQTSRRRLGRISRG